MTRRRRQLIALALLGSLLMVIAAPAPAADPDFHRVWVRVDGPVADLRVSRTWIWGPHAITGEFSEPYAEAPGGWRTVQYFDKSRMEVNHAAGAGPVWQVTQGRLVWELVSGQMQVGDSSFEARGSAHINVAGDLDDPNGPTYATFAGVLSYPSQPVGSLITQTINRAGQIGDDPALAAHGVSAAHYVPETGHTVASVFWTFINSSGLVSVDGQLTVAPLFENPYYGTGYPIAPAFWTTVRVGGAPRQVLVQVFERRVLTYTPGNPDGWQVEAGNVGLHYHAWRYSRPSSSPAPDGSGGGTDQTRCEQHQEQQSSNGNQTVRQSNSSTIVQSGGGTQTAVCEQTNRSVQGP